MEPSLSLVLPVYNVQSTLGSQVARMLDVLPELTGRFELLIVDNGSTDLTAEVADELARQFPQVRLISQRRYAQSADAAQAALPQAAGQYVFVFDDLSADRESELRQMWRRRDELVAMTRREPAAIRPLKDDTVERLMKWGEAITQNSSTAETIRDNQSATASSAQKAERDETSSATKNDNRIERTDLVGVRLAMIRRRPKFLSRMRDFVVGE